LPLGSRNATRCASWRKHATRGVAATGAHDACYNPTMQSNLHHIERGSGPTVVLLHGFPLDSRVFESQLADLSDKYRVVIPDLPGFGQSRSDESFTIDSQAESVHAYLKQINALPCVLAGLSMGGYIALAFTQKF